MAYLRIAFLVRAGSQGSQKNGAAAECKKALGKFHGVLSPKKFYSYSTIAAMLPAIAVFAKAPIPGRVKTRLAATLGDERAAHVYRKRVDVLLDRLLSGPVAAETVLELYSDIETDVWRRDGVSERQQTQGDLGVRMLAALAHGLAAGAPRVMIIGGDAPTVPLAFYRQLLTSSADVALGPAEDGGYYAISCRRAMPEMFTAVAWSSATALADTVAACRAAGLTVEIGSTWFDIDVPADLERIS